MASRKSKAISKARKELLLKMESIIGESCFNGNIQNWHMWEYEDEGRWFRYPITFYEKDGQKDKRWYPEAKMATDKLRTGHYAFGANQLYIIEGLMKALEYLEDNHGLKVEGKKKRMKDEG